MIVLICSTWYLAWFRRPKLKITAVCNFSSLQTWVDDWQESRLWLHGPCMRNYGVFRIKLNLLQLSVSLERKPATQTAIYRAQFATNQQPKKLSILQLLLHGSLSRFTFWECRSASELAGPHFSRRRDHINPYWKHKWGIIPSESMYYNKIMTLATFRSILLRTDRERQCQRCEACRTTFSLLANEYRMNQTEARLWGPKKSRKSADI